MTVATPRELDELRSRIDRIDEAIVDLLGERLGVVAEIARVKGADAAAAGLALRPAREAQVVRRLVGRGAARILPRPTLVRLWRELFAAATRAQSPFAVCVCVPPHQPELWDIARDHFGSLTPLHRADSPGHALRLAAGPGGRVVAVLPLPGEGDRWWTALDDASPGAPRVVARLPFAALPGYPEGLGGLVVASLALEPSGDDLTLLAVETDGTVSAGRLRDLLAPLRPRLLASLRDAGPGGGGGGGASHLVEVDGFGDPGVAAALAPLGERLLRVVAAGCYARPLAAADLV